MLVREKVLHFIATHQVKWILWALLGLIAVGFFVRVWGISYGLPYMYHPDEPLGVATALNMIKTGDLNPHFFGYGSLFFYLNAMAYLPYFLFGQVIGLFHTPADVPNLQMLIMGVGRTFMPSQVILVRLVSVVEGVVCIPVTYWLGMRLRNRKTGLLAAAFVALSPSLVLHSQFVTPNILTTLGVLLTLAAMLRLTPQSRWPSYVLVGGALGCAVASKYNAGILFLSYGFTCLALHRWAALRKWNVYLGFITASLAFVAVTPYSILDFQKFLADTQFHLAYYSSASHPGMEGDTLGFYIRYLLSSAGPIVFLSIIPLISYMKARNRPGLILASFAVPYIAYISTLRIRNDRTILIALPILFIIAADLLYATWQQISSLRLKRLAQFALVVFVCGSIAYLGLQTTMQDIRQATPNAVEYARQWIEANVSSETRIAAEVYSPFIDPLQHKVTYVTWLISNTPDWYVQQGYDLLVLSSPAYARYYAMPDQYPIEIAEYDTLLSRFKEVIRFNQNGVTIKILSVKP
jgi:4-amino-4-deoxy-L-arabinose transferase-like glycosyltransferase